MTDSIFSVRIPVLPEDVPEVKAAKLILNNLTPQMRVAAMDARDQQGRTPLHIAAKNGNLTLMKLYLEAGADVNARCEQGRTTLHYAVEYANEQEAKNPSA